MEGDFSFCRRALLVPRRNTLKAKKSQALRLHRGTAALADVSKLESDGEATSKHCGAVTLSTLGALEFLHWTVSRYSTKAPGTLLQLPRQSSAPGRG